MLVKRNFIASAIIMLGCCTPWLVQADEVTNDVKSGSKDMVMGAEDAIITTKVKALYAVESDIPSFHIKVSTTNHIVHLDGTVDTQLQAARAVEIAQGVKDVKDVDSSKLKIVSSDHYLSDAFITAKVKGKILQLANDDKLHSGYDLHVETTNNVVHIFGKVHSSDEIKAVEDAAKSVADVKDVKSDIQVVK